MYRPATWRDGYRYAAAGIVLVHLYLPGQLPVADVSASRGPEKSMAPDERAQRGERALPPQHPA